MTPIPNTFGTAANAAIYIEYSSEEELSALVLGGRITRPYLHIGRGSNLLFTRDWPGTVLHSRMTGLEEVSRDGGYVTVRVGAGYLWDDFVEECVRSGWYGAENLSYIPSETGAAAVQNIGAYGCEVKDIIEAVSVTDLETGESRLFSRDECRYSYRRSIFKLPEYRKYAVTSVLFRLSLTEHYTLGYGALKDLREPSLRKVRDTVTAIRREKLPEPSQTGSAGSFFMNPVVPLTKLKELQQMWPDIPHYPAPDYDALRFYSDIGDSGAGTDYVKLSAGWLIQQCGWRGKSAGRAGVWEKQALVIVNLGGATGAEILALAEEITASVREKFGITLRPEVIII